MTDGVMIVRVLSVASEVFRGKNGAADTQMYRVYMADHKGRVGYVYTRTEVHAGEVVALGLAERDGRLRLTLLGLAGAETPQV